MALYSYAYSYSHDECEFVTKKYFQINNCGALKTDKFMTSIRPPRNDYMLIYHYAGKGWTEINGKQLNTYPGDVVYLKPGAPLHFALEQNAMHFWIHFTGSAVDDMFKECGIAETGKYSTVASNDLWEILTDIYIHQSIPSTSMQLQAKSFFFQFLSLLAEFLTPDQTGKNVIREKKIYPALKEMQINFDKNHKIEYYANLCDISLSSFQHIFTKITGITPQKYLTTIRMETAKKMLSSGNISIKDIAARVGYEDQLYFSRIFKKTVGVSPSEYSKNK